VSMERMRMETYELFYIFYLSSHASIQPARTQASIAANGPENYVYSLMKMAIVHLIEHELQKRACKNYVLINSLHSWIATPSNKTLRRNTLS
jgi:hypothetical protein